MHRFRFDLRKFALRDSVLLTVALGHLVFMPTVMAQGTTPSAAIRMNQWGFAPNAPKQAAVVTTTATAFAVLDSATGDTAFSGTLGAGVAWTLAQETAKLADFSALKTAGKYRLVVPGVGTSGVFRIDDKVYADAYIGLSRYYYFNRASEALPATHAGIWARAAGHPDNQVRVHASAATTALPTNTLINVTSGWYDAGDYNKYMGPTAFTVGFMMGLLEDRAAFVAQNKLNLPESANSLPDLLDEALLGVRMLLRSQDPNDGGVYHKITSAGFSGFVMPQADVSQRYAVQKSVTVTLATAAALAKTARALAPYAQNAPELKALADSCLAAARKAWDWSLANPTKYYNQTLMNQNFTPAIETGEYGDNQATDEKFWAGIELGLTTGEATYLDAVHPQATLTGTFNPPTWASVQSLGLFSLASQVIAEKPLPARFAKADIVNRFNTLATSLRGRGEATPFGIRMTAQDLNWGSNGTIAAHGVIYVLAHRLTGNAAFLESAVTVADYLYGRNAVGLSFVTGFGWAAAMNPHHRPSGADNIDAPIPGMLVGGPNSGRQDEEGGCTYTAPTQATAKSYTDAEPCYASNEVTIYWNAPMVYLLGAMAATYLDGSVSIQKRDLRQPKAPKTQPRNGFLKPKAGTSLFTANGRLHQGYVINP
jgi:endoglucanase